MASPLLRSSETSYSYHGNRLIAENGARPSHILYDDCGRMVTKGDLDFEYNQAGRIVRVMKHGRSLAEYGYDGFGRRVKKQVSRLVRYFHYDLQGRLISISNRRGRPVRDFIYMDEELVAMKVHRWGRGLYFFVNDHLGTPRKIINRSGRVVWHAAYEPFGRAHLLTQRVICNLRFPGQYFDHETGLHYNWHRYYDPSSGRYLTPDPIGLAGGLQTYAYAGNNPVNWIDPFGLWSVDVGGSLMGADFTATIYDSDIGFLPSSKTLLTTSTTAFGGGFKINLDNSNNFKKNTDLMVSWGISKYLGFSYSPNLDKKSLNLGLGLGLPVSFSSSYESFTRGIAKFGRLIAKLAAKPFQQCKK